MRALVTFLLFASCAPPPALTDFPEPSALSDSSELPNLFLSATSSDRATTKDTWETWRRPQLEALFSHYQYGFVPERVSITAQHLRSSDTIVPGATWDDYWLTFGDGTERIQLALIRPKGVANPPVILGLNKCGNQSIVVSPEVMDTQSFVIPACGGSADAARGIQASAWSLEQVVARGFAVATFHDADAAPDDPNRFSDNFRSAFRLESEPRTRWGTIAVWAWTLAHVAAWLEQRADVDPTRIYAFGHSRRGKAALLAGMMSKELDGVVAHQSGTAGSALHRSLEGETIAIINSAFPHWFNTVFKDFADAELRTPVDQHQLMALWAPRRVVLVDGDDDAWADPQGSRMAAEAAAPAWTLYGSGDVPSWQSRPGGHEVRPEDWTRFLDALER